MCTAVDIATVLPKGWMDKIVAAKVWKEKQAQLDELVKAVEATPKLSGGKLHAHTSKSVLRLVYAKVSV